MSKKNSWNRLLSVFLSLAMLLSLATPAMAADNDNVSFTKVDNSRVTAKLPGREVTENTQEEPAYEANDVVRVSIFLEKAGTIEAGYDTVGIADDAEAMNYRNVLKKEQTALVQKIEKATGEDLDVVWNLTLATNLISANIKFGQIEAIEAIPGVREVVLETQYSPDVVSSGAADPNMATSGKQTGSAAAWAAGYTGAGSKVAIIDTGLDVAHEAFDAEAFAYSLGLLDGEYDLMTAEDIASVLSELHVAQLMEVTADDLYVNAKVPFGFNYVDVDLDLSHYNSEHGSHVAGIAAANAYVARDDAFVPALTETFVQGVAPDAQVIVMKVFGASGGAYDSDYMAAIEDALILGADSVNLSLGSGNPGMSRSDAYQHVMESLVSSGLVAVMSAGNSGSWVEQSNTMNLMGTGYLYSDDVSMQTDGMPGSYTNSLAVASVDNDGTTGLYFTVDDLLVVYNEMLEGSTGVRYNNEPLATLAGEHEFVIIDGVGTPEDWAAVGDALEGKIAMCSRGETSFYEKAEAAVDAGAIATIIYNNQSGIINMDLSSYSYTEPCVSITQAEGAAIKAAATAVTGDNSEVLYYTGTITISDTAGAGQYNSDYYTLSSFSSWGVPGSLELKPEITAPGGNINSVAGYVSGLISGHDKYELMSGTSMAAPQVTGMVAVLAQYIRENGLEEKTGLDARTLAQSLLMSTAVPMLNGENGYYYPVLQQGAGLANVGNAVAADSYILMGKDATASFADGKVKAELGDDPNRDGNYSFSFTINNLTDEEKTYALSADFFTQDAFLYYANDQMSMSQTALFMDTLTTPLDAVVTYSVNGKELSYVGDLDNLDLNGDGVVNTADGQAILDYITDVADKLADKDMADLDADGDIDSYDAYLFFSRLQGMAVVPANSSVEVTVDVKLSGIVYSLDNQGAFMIETLFPNGAYVEGYVYAESVSSEEGVAGTAHSIPVLGFYGNWSDASMFEKGTNAEYQTGDEYRLPYLGDPSVNSYTVVYANEPGTNYYFGGNPLVPDGTYMPERNAINSENGDMIGKVSFAAIRNAAASRFTFVNETTGETLLEALPGAVSSAYYYVNGGTWRNTGYSLNAKLVPAGIPEGTALTAALTLAPEYYVDAEGNVDWDALGEGATFSVPMVIDNTAPVLEDVSLSLTGNTLTVTASDNQYIAAVVLYNKSGSAVYAYTGAKQDIAPEESAEFVLDLSEIKGSQFLLQVVDYAMNTTTYEVKLQGSEEEDNLPDMIAYDLDNGYWTSFSKNSRYNELDVYANSNYTYYAGTIVDEYVFAATDAGELHVMPLEDLTDVTVVSNLGVTVSDMAYNAADGKLYGNVNGYLITLDKLTGEIGIVGEIGVLTNTLACDAKGTFYCSEYGTGKVYSFTLDTLDAPVLLCNVNIASQYVQAMEIDPNSGMLYWASFYVNRYGYAYLFEIDTATGEYTRYNDLWYEMAALLIPEKSTGGSWDAPTNEVSGMQLSAEAMSLLRGSSATLSAIVQPWTASDRTVTWTSDDETIATVDENGKVTAVAVGTTTITATSNLDSAFSATCEITVTTLDYTVEGVLQDAEGNSMLFTWDMANDSTWTAGADMTISIASAAYDAVHEALFVQEASAGAMNKIDMTTGETLQTSPACAFGAAMFDLAAMEIFTTEETPAVMGTYGNYIMIPCDPMANTFNQGWNLTSYLAQYTGGSKFVAMTSVGLYMDDDTVNELVYALDDAGYIWALFYDGTTSIGFDFIPTNLDLSFPMSGDLQYCSLVDAADGSLFLSYFTGTTNEIYYLTPSADGSMFNAVRVGDVGEDVWPAALTAVTKNGEAADSNAVAISTENMMTVDAAEISAEEIAAVNAQLAFATAASVDNTAKAAEATNAAEETKTAETVSFTAASSKFAPLPIETNSSDDNTFIVTVMAKDAKGGIVDSTNGKITVTYDPTQVTTEQVVVSGQYSAVNDDGNGTIVLAYVGPDAIPAGEPAATVIFKNKATKNTEVVVEHDEYADQKPGYVETKVVELTNLPRPAISVSLAEKVVLNYYVDEDLVTQTNQLVVKKNGEALSEDEYEVVFENNEARISISLNANDMCDEMSFQILDSKGNPVTQCRVASIRDYVRLRLDSAKASDKEKRVFMAALDYGAMAQLVLDATETNLANNIITAKDRELLDNFTWPTATNDPDEAVGSTNESKFAVTASLKDAVVLNFYIYKTDLDDNKIQIKRNGTVLTEGEDYTVTEVGTEYCVSIPMNANHMCHIFSAQVVDAEGNAVYAARSLSMRHYVGMRLVNPNATAAEKRVFVAALDYGALAQLAMNENATDLANRYITDADREALKP